MNQTVLEIEALSFGYDGKPSIYRDFALSIRRGEIVAVLGPSGIGKSTLLDLIAGFMPPLSGAIRHARLAQVYQDPYVSFHPSYTIRASIAHVAANTAIEPLAEAMGLERALLERYPHELSGGQLQRFSIARALAMRPDLLMADEPVSSLDLATQLEVMTLMVSRLENYGMLLVTHDESLAAWCADRVVRIGS